MELSEEQRNPWRAIVAGSDYNLSSQDWEDLLTELDSLYTESPIAPPASEQKPVAWVTTNEDGDYAMLFFDQQEARSYSGDDEPIGLAPVSASALLPEQENYKAQREAERYRWLRDHSKSWSWNPSQYNKEIVSGFAAFNTGYSGFEFESAIDAAIASVKGGSE